MEYTTSRTDLPVLKRMRRIFQRGILHKHRVTVGAYTDVGCVRSENEDTYGYFPPHPASTEAERLFIVADGMGGHTRGREASHIAVQMVQQIYFGQRGQPVLERLHQAFVTTNTRIYQTTRANGLFDQMGTTCSALSIADSHIYIAHVGDSRIYQINRKGIKKLTRDHTLPAALHREGILTAQEAYLHPQRHVLLQALGMKHSLEVDLLDIGPCRPGDSYLLCSDGLADVPEKDIQSIALQNPPQQACEKLVHLAKERDGLDNITTLLLHIR